MCVWCVGGGGGGGGGSFSNLCLAALQFTDSGRSERLTVQDENLEPSCVSVN